MQIEKVEFGDFMRHRRLLCPAKDPEMQNLEQALLQHRHLYVSGLEPWQIRRLTYRFKKKFHCRKVRRGDPKRLIWLDED